MRLAKQTESLLGLPRCACEVPTPEHATTKRLYCTTCIRLMPLPADEMVKRVVKILKTKEWRKAALSTDGKFLIARVGNAEARFISPKGMGSTEFYFQVANTLAPPPALRLIKEQSE